MEGAGPRRWVKSAGLADGWLKGQGGWPGDPQVSGLAPRCGSSRLEKDMWLEGDVQEH